MKISRTIKRAFKACCKFRSRTTKKNAKTTEDNAKPKQDLLSNLPPEVLLQIINHVPTSSFIDLVHTSSYFSRFFALYARSICNNKILTNRELDNYALILDSRYVDGWLMPFDSAFQFSETMMLEGNGMMLGETALLPSQLRIRLTQPGPQFLVFLEREGKRFIDDWDFIMYPEEYGVFVGGQWWFCPKQQRLMKMTKKERRVVLEKEVFVRCLRRFLRDINGIDLDVYDGFYATLLGGRVQGDIRWFYRR